MQESSTKQKNQEKGAFELAITNQSTFSVKNEGRKSTRHGARNQHRHKHFTRWILSTFPHILDECIDNDEDGDVSTKKHILDVAGGKGELSVRLCLCHSLNVTMIDPRQADLAFVYMNSVVPKLPNKWRASIEKRLKEHPTFVEDLLTRRYEQLVMPFIIPNYSWQNGDIIDVAYRRKWCQNNISPILQDAVQNASLIIGLHADGATEAIVDAALFYNKPFVIVPCCVFPNLFNNRFNTVQYADGTFKQTPVRTHEQFCEYLLNKDQRFKREVLPFEGRNIAIWWDGKP